MSLNINMRLNAMIVLILLGAAILLAGCQATMPVNKTGGPGSQAPITIEIREPNATAPANTSAAAPEEGIVITKTEGDLVQLKPVAYDPDNDKISYYFSKPFDTNGKWQTKVGDTGKYFVTVTASDGKANTTEEVVIIINKAKSPPVIECPKEVIAKEGELLKLNCNIYDPDGESVIVEYSGFMKGPTYQTKFGDAGNYTVQIKASNKEKTTTGSVKIVILHVNQAPVITGVPDSINATETDIVTINPKVSDPDGDKVTITFSQPFDKNGVWKTQIKDAGTYAASVVASDGQATTKRVFTLNIARKDTPPVLTHINDITVNEGDTITLPIDAYDNDGDKVNVTVKGWMNSPTYTTVYGDAGVYTVTVVANDGNFQTQQEIKVTVLHKNRAPVFSIPV